MKLKKLVQTLLISTALLMPVPSFSSGIPVVDVASIAEAIKTIIELQKHYSELKEQTGLSIDQLQALTGARGLANLVNDPTSRYYIPAEYQEVLQLTAGIAGGDYDDLQNRVDALLNAAKIIDVGDTAFGAASIEGQAFVADQNQIAINSALAEESYNEASRRTANLQVLLDRVNTADDAKEIADLQARISAEQLMLTNEQNKLIALSETQEAYWERREQQIKEGRIKALGNGEITEIVW